MRFVLLGIGDTLRTLRIGCACDTCKGESFRILSSRTRFSILIDSKKSGKVLFDTSPDLRGQLSKAHVSRINVIVLTHPHYDHDAGFGELARIRGDIDSYGAHKTLNCVLFQPQFINLNRRDGLCMKYLTWSS